MGSKNHNKGVDMPKKQSDIQIRYNKQASGFQWGEGNAEGQDRGACVLSHFSCVRLYETLHGQRNLVGYRHESTWLHGL